jgi:enoyl-CoA hydratase/carnithine racemase
MDYLESSAFNRLSVQEENGTVIVQLDTGHKANAFCLETMRELTSIALALSDRIDINSVILTGKSNIFTGGMDLTDPLIVDPKSCDI